MAFQVVITRRANADIATTELWLSQLGLSAMHRWRVRLMRMVENLEKDPHRYPQAEDAAELGIDLREAAFGRRPHIHRILFVIHEQTVIIQRVRHAAQDRLKLGDV